MEKEKINLGDLFHSFQSEGINVSLHDVATSGAGTAYHFGVHHMF
jgi:hypothetical protein